MTQKPTPSALEAVPPAPSDEAALNIAEYLREEAEDPPPPPQGLAALTLGAVGVVYGDIGTSPIYAFRKALRPVSGDGLTRVEVLGLLSIIIWTLILIVTLKYVLFLVQRHGTGVMSVAFGPITAVWFLVLSGLGLWNVAAAPGVLAGFTPPCAAPRPASGSKTPIRCHTSQRPAATRLPSPASRGRP